MRVLCSIAVIALASVGCFDPDFPTDLPCGPDQFCPDGQTCNADNICVASTGSSVDAGATADATPRIDADGGLGALTSIDIGDDVTLPLGQTHTFVVTGVYENGQRQEDNIFVIWTSSNNAIAFVDFMGVAHPQAEGTVTITADFEGRVDTADILVTPAP